jgi:hypothetical protein
MELDTFLTTLYVIVDDWYRAEMSEMMKRHGGPALKMSDSEVLTLAVAGQWRAGVPWQSERGMVRYMQHHGRRWFPHMLGRSSFNERVRQLWAALIALHHHLAGWLTRAEDIYECADCVPLPACSMAQSRKRGHWLWASRIGWGGNQGGWYYGEQLLVSSLPSGVVTGWLLGPADADDRWLFEAFLSQRSGQMQVVGPARHTKQVRTRSQLPASTTIGPLHSAAGHGHPRPYLADQGFNGPRWQHHWAQHYGAQVLTVPPANMSLAWPLSAKRWLGRCRQIIESAFAWLTACFSLSHLQAHSRWGQFTRLAAIFSAFNFGILCNRLLGRPDGTLETLLS